MAPLSPQQAHVERVGYINHLPPGVAHIIHTLRSHIPSHTSLRYNVTRSHMDELTSAIISLGYQFILLDCPAGIDVGFINAISPAREALIVTTPEITSIRDAGEATE